jgi:hypothetical protein
MLNITYSLLLVYALPVFFIYMAAIKSDFFTVQDWTIYAANAITGASFNFFRDSFGTIVLPLLTAYSAPRREAGAKLPNETFYLFFSLIVFFVLVTILYAIVTCHVEDLGRFSIVKDNKIILDVPNVFQTTILAYGKETLAYIALVLGISIKKT